MSERNALLSACQKLGNSLMTPIAVLPAAGLLLRFGKPDMLNILWMVAAGNALFDNLSLLFAVGIAVGFADENNGVAGLAAVVGYLIFNNVALAFDTTINMGVLGGIIIGIMAGNLYNRYKSVHLPDFFGFFGGKRFVPIVTSACSVILGVISGLFWPLIQTATNNFGNFIANAGVVGAFIYGFLNRLLIPLGLHHVLNTLIWFQFGTFKDVSGKIVNGDLHRFFSLDKTAGTYMTGFFPIMMFALPAACIAMIAAAKKENRKKVTGMLLGIAFTAFLTGVTEPIEFTFIFLAPVLYIIHALLTGVSMALCAALGIKDGFTFSAGAIDYAMNFKIATKPVLLLLIGVVYAFIYYLLFYFSIIKFNLPTPGRTDDFNDNESSSMMLGNKEPVISGNSEIKQK
nr:PTS transporter subunit EIIC [Clostridium akagii]